jgi:hypothetical protein
MAMPGWWSWVLRVIGRRRKPKIPDEPPYKKLERRGEEIYDEMYETRSPHGYLSEIKECFNAAIDAAEADGLSAEAQRLQARLDHIVAVYRSQFT